MNYVRYILEFFIVAVIMSAGLHYLIDQTWQNALIIGFSTALLTVINKFFLDRKALRKTKSSN